eukprot:1153884-Pelagomonas_calceolata.AAC.4
MSPEIHHNLTQIKRAGNQARNSFNHQAGVKMQLIHSGIEDVGLTSKGQVTLVQRTAATP